MAAEPEAHQVWILGIAHGKDFHLVDECGYRFAVL